MLRKAEFKTRKVGRRRFAVFWLELKGNNELHIWIRESAMLGLALFRLHHGSLKVLA
jgi:hypothetical protein